MPRRGAAAPVASLCFSLLAAGGAAAEERRGEQGPSLYFGLATSYVYDFNRPDDLGRDSFNAKSYAGGAQDRSFNIDLLQIGVFGTRGRASYLAKIDLGDRSPGTRGHLINAGHTTPYRDTATLGMGHETDGPGGCRDPAPTRNGDRALLAGGPGM